MTSASPGSGPAADRIAAHAQAAELLGYPWPARLRRVRADRSYWEPSFIELAIGLARGFDILPSERRRWAQLAVEAAIRGRSRRAEELEALAWAVLGLAYRVLRQLPASRVAFRRCHALRYRVRDPLEVADTCYLEASYWREVGYWCTRGWWLSDLQDRGQLALIKAAELIDEALRLAAPSAADSVLACYEIQAGGIAYRAERWPVAITMLESAVERFDPAVHPRLALVAGHTLAQGAVGMGKLDSAMGAVLSLQRSYDSESDPKASIVRDWLVADIARIRGHLSEAEIRFRALRSRTEKQRMLCDLADLDLEIADLAARRGDWSTVEHLASRAARQFMEAGAPFAAQVAIRLSRSG